MQKAIIKTALPLQEEQRIEIETKFRQALEDVSLCFSYEIDSALIGGIVAYVDGKRYDMSLQSKLQGLQKELRKASAAAAAEEAPFSESVQNIFFERLRRLDWQVQISEYGKVISCADGVVQISGLSGSRYGEILRFENDAFGMALDLSITGVGAVLLTEADSVQVGSGAYGTGHVLDVRVGSALTGRVVDPLGRPLDGKPLNSTQYRPIECPAPGIMDRAPVNRPLQTGILAVDSMIPIGKGQRELIIGDRQMGKSAIALSAMLNQSRQGVICIYCAIGQKASAILQLRAALEEADAMQNCVIVASTAADSAAMQYITPYAGCSIAEDFMYAGKDVLIIYDDLSKHANSYRAMSLLLRRPPGREAYPGDVFYLHSRLLERAAQLSPEKGGGSMTALPIVETMAGDISAYIPTNVISITDGQIYLESELFHAGVRPAVNVGLSVSRVGRAAQVPAMRDLCGQLRLSLAQYRELAVFAQFDSDIDAQTRDMLRRGAKLTELMKQEEHRVYTLAEQLVILLAHKIGIFDSVSLQDIAREKERLLAYAQANHAADLKALEQAKALPATLMEGIARFGETACKA